MSALENGLSKLLAPPSEIGPLGTWLILPQLLQQARMQDLVRRLRIQNHADAAATAERELVDDDVPERIGRGTRSSLHGERVAVRGVMEIHETGEQERA